MLMNARIRAPMCGALWSARGFCPDSVLVSIGSFLGGVFLFVGAMLTGIVIHNIVSDR
jgi:hypothetical protein